MRRVMLALLSILALIFGYASAKSMASGMMSKGGEAFEASRLIGTTIKDFRGNDLGTITDIVTGPESRVAFAVVRYWVSDDTQERVAVPLGALSCEEQICLLDASRDKLESAPPLVSEDDLAEPNRARDIYRYFGILPYWTEEKTQ